MLGILLVREGPIPGWFLLAYPVAGAMLAYMASRNSHEMRGITEIGAGLVAGAALFLLFAILNVFLLDFLVEQVLARVFPDGEEMRRMAFLVLPAAAFCLAWAIERRMVRGRRDAVEQALDAHLSGRRSNAFTGI